MPIQTVTDAAAWNALIAHLTDAYPLQTWEWGEIKRPAGWFPHRIALLNEDGSPRAAAQVLTRSVPQLPLSMLYIPRGPIVDPVDTDGLQALMQAIRAYGKTQGAIFCKIDPPWLAGTHHSLAALDFQPSNEKVQVTDTYTIDLTQSEEQILAAMRPKTRQYIRKGEREGIIIEHDTTGKYLDACYQMYHETAQRAQFDLHSAGYYHTIFTTYPADLQYLYVALLNDVPVSFLWMAGFGRFAVELYGGISEQGQQTKANFVMKWQAIQAMKAHGYEIYDLNGRVNEGIGQFKEGFGPESISWIGPFDQVYRPMLYHAWTRALPFARTLLARNHSHEQETHPAV